MAIPVPFLHGMSIEFLAEGERLGLGPAILAAPSVIRICLCPAADDAGLLRLWQDGADAD